MINATKKWIFLKVSSIILIPLMVWFIINLLLIYYELLSPVEVSCFAEASRRVYVCLNGWGVGGADVYSDGMDGWDGKPLWLKKCAKKCSRMIFKIWSGVDETISSTHQKSQISEKFLHFI